MPETIRERRRQWFKNGFASLADQPRSREPRKLSDEHRARLKMWVEAEPLSSRTLIIRLKTEYGVDVSAGTLRNELKRMGYV
ncbi:helix-turn-helix domain-containing protein [Methylosarcina fibrata]|uniref:helix-turn-helix domain-containing protein n=1 Tax=Methylosarcina fibrata TaxID=105972 RepID=UPI001E3C46E6|nr:helix-turn-helix domain-containing protein [Methylosarcina fibrata]